MLFTFKNHYLLLSSVDLLKIKKICTSKNGIYTYTSIYIIIYIYIYVYERKIYIYIYEHFGLDMLKQIT